MISLPPTSTLTYTRFHYTPLFRSGRDVPMRLPLVLRRLVAADMVVTDGEQRHHRVEHVFEEGEGRLVGVEEVGKDAPIMARRRWRLGNRRAIGRAACRESVCQSV